MAAEAADPALRPLAPGGLITIGSDALAAYIAPAAGGRIAQLLCDGVPWLYSHEQEQAAIAWGCYPMLPWAGRIRHGRFPFEGRDWRLPASLGAHAIHGVGFVMPWQVEAHSSARIEMSLQLPCDETWPFGGRARQRISARGRVLRLELLITAGDVAMPRPVLGWHPWFVKPEQLDFAPTGFYPRDAEGIATLPPVAPPPGPWDDCFLNTLPIVLHRAGQALRLTSGCDHWVVFDERAQATCVEPQSGPPDAFNLHPAARLAPGDSVAAWFELEWLVKLPA